MAKLDKMVEAFPLNFWGVYRLPGLEMMFLHEKKMRGCLRTLFIKAFCSIYKLKQIIVETFAAMEKTCLQSGIKYRLNTFGLYWIKTYEFLTQHKGRSTLRGQKERRHWVTDFITIWSLERLWRVLLSESLTCRSLRDTLSSDQPLRSQTTHPRDTHLLLTRDRSFLGGKGAPWVPANIPLEYFLMLSSGLGSVFLIWSHM